MKYRDFAAPRGCPRAPTMRAIMEEVGTAHAERIRPEVGWHSPADRAAFRFEVECHGLTGHDLGEAFAGGFHGRKRWCRENCRSGFAVEPIRPEGGAGRDSGRRFLFSDQADAAAFRRRWP